MEPKQPEVPQPAPPTEQSQFAVWYRRLFGLNLRQKAKDLAMPAARAGLVAGAMLGAQAGVHEAQEAVNNVSGEKYEVDGNKQPENNFKNGTKFYFNQGEVIQIPLRGVNFHTTPFHTPKPSGEPDYTLVDMSNVESIAGQKIEGLSSILGSNVRYVDDPRLEQGYNAGTSSASSLAFFVMFKDGKPGNIYLNSEAQHPDFKYIKSSKERFTYTKVDKDSYQSDMPGYAHNPLKRLPYPETALSPQNPSQ